MSVANHFQLDLKRLKADPWRWLHNGLPSVWHRQFPGVAFRCDKMQRGSMPRCQQKGGNGWRQPCCLAVSSFITLFIVNKSNLLGAQSFKCWSDIVSSFEICGCQFLSDPCQEVVRSTKTEWFITVHTHVIEMILEYDNVSYHIILCLYIHFLIR